MLSGSSLREISICALIATTIAAFGGAQEAPSSSRPVTSKRRGSVLLGRAPEILWKQSPLLLAERQREAGASGELEQAPKYPDPPFGVETESFEIARGASGEQELCLTVQQPILRAGKRGKSIDVAGALLRAARNDARGFERTLSFRLKKVFAALVLAQSDLELANQILEDFDEVNRPSRIRYERGAV